MIAKTASKHGQYLQEKISLSKYSTRDFARIIGIAYINLMKILRGEIFPAPTTIVKMAKVLNMEAEELAKALEVYRIRVVEHKLHAEITKVDRMAKLHDMFPITNLIDNHWFPETSELAVIEAGLRARLGLADPLDFDAQSPSLDTFQSDYLDVKYKMLGKDIMRERRGKKLAYHMAGRYSLPAYDEASLRQCAGSMITFAGQDDGVGLFIDQLFRSGVIFLYLDVDGLSNNYHSGSFWLEEHPVIVYTGFWKNVDMFWYSILHQIGHIISHDINDNQKHWCEIIDSRQRLYILWEEARRIETGTSTQRRNSFDAEHAADAMFMQFLPWRRIEMAYDGSGRDTVTVIESLPELPSEIVTGYFRWTRRDFRYRRIDSDDAPRRFSEIYDPAIEGKYKLRKKRVIEGEIK